jgi:hypothetical protein
MDIIYQIWAILEALPIIVTICSTFVAMTDTPKDDKLWGKIYKYIEILAINFGKAKQQAGLK